MKELKIMARQEEGHIPGAINIPFTEFLNKDGTLKTAKEIKAILDSNGIDKDDEIVTYCTAGIALLICR